MISHMKRVWFFFQNHNISCIFRSTNTYISICFKTYENIRFNFSSVWCVQYDTCVLQRVKVYKEIALCHWNWKILFYLLPSKYFIINFSFFFSFFFEKLLNDDVRTVIYILFRLFNWSLRFRVILLNVWS